MIDDRQLGPRRLSELRRELAQDHEPAPPRAQARSDQPHARTFAAIRLQLVRDIDREIDDERRSG